ncbi:hypothetical protein ACEUZ9_002797 [Paracoccus litorisediminis]|uniref:hypothetical protein n=1 Tax=Paracoccus litorisediminis TaxID=2006130 RepID=UPI00372DC4CA
MDHRDEYDSDDTLQKTLQIAEGLHADQSSLILQMGDLKLRLMRMTDGLDRAIGHVEAAQPDTPEDLGRASCRDMVEMHQLGISACLGATAEMAQFRDHLRSAAALELEFTSSSVEAPRAGMNLRP